MNPVQREQAIQTGGSGISFGGLLCILFIALKLTNYIAWSWLWVLSPLWIPIALCFAVAAVALCVLVIVRLFAAFFGLFRPKKLPYYLR